MSGNNGLEMQMCLQPLVCFFFFILTFFCYTKHYSNWLLPLEPQWWQWPQTTTPTPTPMPATMNSKWQGLRFITSWAPGMTAMTPWHHSNLFLPHHNKQHRQTTIYSSLTSSHCLSIAPTTTPTSYLNGKVPHLFFFVFFLLIILSIRSTAATPVHHHYQYLQSTPNHIGSRRVCVSSLRSFFFMCHRNTAPPHWYEQGQGYGHQMWLLWWHMTTKWELFYYLYCN